MFPWYLWFSWRDLLFPSISLHWLLRKAFLSLLAILWISAYKWIYLSFSLLPLPSLFFSAICKVYPNILPFFISFSWGWSWSLPPVQCHKPPFIVHQALCLSDLLPWIYLSLPLYNHKGFDLGHTLMVSWFSLLCSLYHLFLPKIFFMFMLSFS